MQAIKAHILFLLNGGLDPETSEPGQLRDRRILAAAMFVVVPANLVLMATNVYLGFGSDNPIIAIGMFACVAALYCQAHFHNPRLAANLAILASFIVLFYFLLQLGMQSTPLLWLFAVSAVAVLLTGRRNGLVWNVAILFAIWTAGLLQFNGIITIDAGQLPNLQEGSLGYAIEGTLILGIITLVSMSFRSSQLKAEKSYQRSMDELEREVHVRSLAEKEAKNSEAAKSAFFAAMNHELRTPLNGVIGAARLLENADEQAKAEYTRIIIQSGETLLELVNNVMDLSSLESGRTQLEHIPVKIRSLVADTLAPLKFQAIQKGLDFSRRVCPTVPLFIAGDPTRIRQILLNLVGNAIKFTEHGAVSVNVDIRYDQLQISVSDTGIGIAPEAQATLFEPYVQAELSTARRFGGSGLGLTITRQLVSAMGGRIHVESTPNKGATFTILLPLQECEAPLDDNHAEAASQIESLNVLVADDNAVNRMVVSRMLEQHKHQVVVVEDGREAVEFISSHDVDLVLMDIQMPIMDGVTALHKIRQMDDKSDTPVYALTANVSERESERIMKSGFDGLFEKPFRYESLLSTIQTHGRQSS